MKKSINRYLIFTIFILAFAIRLYSFLPSNIIIGFDQARDFFDAIKITQGDLRIIGPTAGNNPNLHHGVAYLYYLATAIFVFGKSPIALAVWNSFFNALTVIVIYFLGESIFDNKKVGLFASIIVAVSFYYVSFSSWLSNPTLTLLTVPLFFLGIWKYFKNKSWGLPLACFALGISIQFELFFIYLIPTGVIAWILLKPKYPTIKNIIISLSILILTLSTMIVTEIKFGFAGTKNIIFAGNFVGGPKLSLAESFLEFAVAKWEAFYLNFWPDNKNFGIFLGIFAVSFLIFEIYENKQHIKRNLFLILWFFSPMIMLFLGVHNAPWFLIGRPASAILIVSYLLSKIKHGYISYLLLALIFIANINAINGLKNDRKMLLEPDKSAILTKQLLVIDYIYKDAGNEKFAINTVTNPLYINLVWAYNYDWYAKPKYKYLPGFAGGDQISPYDVLPVSNNKEKIFYLIIDETSRIPEIHKKYAIDWALKNGKQVNAKEFDGILVQKYIRR